MEAMQQSAERCAKSDNAQQQGPEVELLRLGGNCYHIFIFDDERDVVGLTPAQARKVVKELQEALATVSWERYGKHKARKNGTGKPDNGKRKSSSVCAAGSG